jgi:L-fucose isomerase
MLAPKVGLIVVSLPPELSTVPAEAVEIANELSVNAEKKLQEVGLEVIRFPRQVQTTEDVLGAAKSLRDKVDCMIYLPGSWIYVPMIATPAIDVPMPIILWGVPHLVLGTSVVSCILHGSLDELGINHKFVYGFPEESDVINEIATYAKAAMVVNRMKGSKYGLIGGRCMYMYTAIPDLIQMKSLFGVETVHIDEYQLILEAEKILDEKARSFLKDVIRKEFGKIQPSEDIMMKSVKLYFALKKVINQYDLDFAGVKCMPEVVSNYVSYCLAVSLMNDEGVVVACECDTNAALTMQIMHLLTSQPVGFADVFHFDKQKKILRLVNCGTLATELAKSRKDVDWGLQYEFIGEKRGATTVFCCKPGRVTLARLSRIKGEYVMHIATGEAFEQPKERFKEARDVWPHAFIKLDGDPETFIQNCRSNHMHFVYGDFKKELIAICSLLKIKPIIT